MYTPRTRFNARARQSSAGSSSHKSRKRLAAATSNLTNTSSNTNAEIIQQKSKEEKEFDRGQRLQQELALQIDSRLTSKKKKRLDKYIEKKLKQEERVEILKKLSRSQAESTSLNLKSSSTLGTGKPSTHRDRLDRLEDKEIRRTIEGGASRKRKRKAFDEPGDDEDSDFMDLDSTLVTSRSQQQNDGSSAISPLMLVDAGFSTMKVEQAPEHVTPAIGSALRKNTDGSVVAPIMIKKKQKGRKTAFQSWKLRNTLGHVPPNAESDTSFDSSDSAYDSTEEEDSEGHSVRRSPGSCRSEAGILSGSGQSSGEESSDNDGSVPEQETTKKQVGFKDWAMKQLSAVKGYVAPTRDSLEQNENLELLRPPTKKRKTDENSTAGRLGELMRGPLGEDLQLPATTFAQHLQGADRFRQAKFVAVSRPPDVAESRLLLPIVAEEQPIMESIMLNPVVIICGETGSGKTTQVPQFLYEAGFGHPESENPAMIGITQPRRVAAMSMASRVAQELSLTSSRVSYQIRYDATVSSSTSIKFMTDGVLLRELASDFLLSKYSVIIIDEAHERSMNTDILIGVLSRVLKLREQMWKDQRDNIKPLRLIIMSATLRVNDFAQNPNLFPVPPPIIDVAARQYPVTVHFNRRTRPDYVTEAIRKASKIHARLPPGGILIFLTGQNEINGVCWKLEKRYGVKALNERKRRRIAKGVTPVGPGEDVASRVISASQVDVEPEDIELGNVEQELAPDVDDDAEEADDNEALDSDSESSAETETLGIDVNETDSPMHIVPLYSLLPSEKQMRVFQPPPDGSRMVVVATNVAETSLTIPGIRYVIDCGRAKERRYDLENGIQAFQISWISKASAAQRAGRAGRTGPGHCYRLYSSAVFENYLESFSTPEILRVPIEGVVLQMKSMHIDAVVNFPFPTPPDRHTLWKSETLLAHLGAVKRSSPNSNIESGSEITELGRAMALFPLSPRFSRMLVSGKQHGCLPYVIAIVSALSVGDPFLREDAVDKEENADEDVALHDELASITSEKIREKEMRRIHRREFFQSQKTHSALGGGISDVFRLLSVVGAYEYAGGGHMFCADNFVRPKAMEEIHKLRGQISNIVQTNFTDVDAGFVPNLKPPSDFQLKVLRQLLTAGFIDQVAVRKDLVETDSASGNKYATSKGVRYKALGISDDVFIHPSSVLFASTPPEYVIFHEVVRTSQVWIKGVTKVNPAWLSSLGKSLCTFSKPVQNRDGVMMVIPKFGDGWELPPIKADSL